MAGVAFEDFAEQEIVRLYLATSIKEATRVEQVLSENGIDYAIELEPYVQITLFSTQFVGAVFYVSSNQADICRKLLETAGLSAGFVE